MINHKQFKAYLIDVSAVKGKDKKGIDGEEHLSITMTLQPVGKAGSHATGKEFLMNIQKSAYKGLYNKVLFPMTEQAEGSPEREKLIEEFNKFTLDIQYASKPCKAYFVHDMEAGKAKPRIHKSDHPTKANCPMVSEKVASYWFDDDQAESPEERLRAILKGIQLNGMFITANTSAEILPLIKNSAVLELMNELIDKDNERKAGKDTVANLDENGNIKIEDSKPNATEDKA